MLKKKLMIISIFLLFILSIGMVSASEDFNQGFEGNDQIAIAEDSTSDLEIEESISRDNSLNDKDILKEGEENPVINPDDYSFGEFQEMIYNANENDCFELEGTFEGYTLHVNKSLSFVGTS